MSFSALDFKQAVSTMMVKLPSFFAVELWFLRPENAIGINVGFNDGLLYSGVLLENSNFWLKQELGPDENYGENKVFSLKESETIVSLSGSNFELTVFGLDCRWSIYDDLFFDTIYNASKSSSKDYVEILDEKPEIKHNDKVKPDADFTVHKRRKICGH
ncbi:Hypothetical predicted protein [Olea europaea subsp. europaea]|uniref:Uncharacterized protein n=1 Tax=Olea europaea subsp. europaea TaxID=158383 RepID=A0A8S0QTZ8_OLEEU|nr:Hypothetical predicted protein [Olea europaea subsp. europaea]